MAPTSHDRLPVVVRDTHKEFTVGEERIVALKGVSLELRAGEMIALTGPSGSGKSTLLRLIACQERPTQGEVIVDGISTTGLNGSRMAKLRRERVGMISQAFNLLESLSALRNVALPLVLQRVPERQQIIRAREALEMVGMAHRERSRPSQLSGGEKQRVAIARAIVHEPAVILADEATGNLDDANARAVIDILRDLCSRGHSIFFATHSSVVAARCDRVVSLANGAIVA